MFTIRLAFPLPSRDMAEIPLKRRKSSIQPTNQPTNQLLLTFMDIKNSLPTTHNQCIYVLYELLIIVTPTTTP